MAFPIGSMPGSEGDPCFGAPENPFNIRQGFGGSCYMTPGGQVCPGMGTGGGSSCYMTPNGMVCPMPETGGSCRMTPGGPVCSRPGPGYGLR
jgi:hypothetical protein